jgi:hypothetical protein
MTERMQPHGDALTGPEVGVSPWLSPSCRGVHGPRRGEADG